MSKQITHLKMILNDDLEIRATCGIVLVQEYILEENSFKQQFNENKDPGTYWNIHDI